MSVINFIKQNRDVKTIRIFSFKNGNLIFDGRISEIRNKNLKNRTIKATQSSFETDEAIVFVI